MNLAIETETAEGWQEAAKTSVIHPHYEGLESVESDKGTQTIKINVDCSLPQSWECNLPKPADSNSGIGTHGSSWRHQDEPASTSL